MAGFLGDYMDKEILPSDPFQTIDQSGIGELVHLGIERGRKVRAKLKIGICGEHGGDPESVKFCHREGMDYVSCSPYRVPIARLAAAQAVNEERAALRNGTGRKKKAKAAAKKKKPRKSLARSGRRAPTRPAKKAKKRRVTARR